MNDPLMWALIVLVVLAQLFSLWAVGYVISGVAESVAMIRDEDESGL